MNLELLPYTPERDLYHLLQIPPEADAETVIAACRRLARTFHPDRNGSPRANEEMQVVNAVRRLLTDPGWRAAYDADRRRYLALRQPLTLVPRPVPQDGRLEPVGPGWLPEAVGWGVRRVWNAVSAPLRPGHCPICAARVEPEYRFCGGCGNRLLTAAQRAG